MPNICARAGVFGSLLAASGLAVSSAVAGGSGENAVLIIDPNDATSLWLGHYYKNARQIPDRNVIYMTPGAANHAAFRAVNLPALAGSVAGIEDHADYILIAPTPTFFVAAPGMITDGCFPVSRFSISGAYSTAFILDDFVGGAASTLANRYFSASNSAVAFDSNTTWLSGAPSTQGTARRYYIGALLGCTAPLGNTPAEIIAMIDRGTAVEGTRPAGTIYLMNNTDDTARNVRSPQFNAVLNTITTSLRRQCEIQPGRLPWGRGDVLGMVSGFSSVDLLGSNITILPGAFCDHLTSYACAFDVSDQTKASAWITKGASGSAGTVEEPCNYTGKFTHSRLHVWYLQGMTLGESYFRSMQYATFQNLLLGDALVRPFAYIPAVTVSGAPSGPVSGVVRLTPAATTDQVRVSIAGFDLLIDGELRGSAEPGGEFAIDTTALSDGWHEVRVLAYDNTPNRTMGRWVGSLSVSNRGRSASIDAAATSGDLSDTLTFTVGAVGPAVREIQLVQNGRVVATAPDAGEVRVKGRVLGAGPSTVHARALFVDGKSTLSPPLALSVTPNQGSGGFPAPTAFSYTKNADPARTLVLELPASFSDDPTTANFQVLSGPTKASVIGGTGAFRVLAPNPGASGEDAVEFRVTTPSGQSSSGRVVIRWGPVCPADFNGDAFVDFFDYDDFVGCFQTGTCAPGTSADFNGDGFVDFFDYDQFVSAFAAGC